MVQLILVVAVVEEQRILHSDPLVHHPIHREVMVVQGWLLFVPHQQEDL